LPQTNRGPRGERGEKGERGLPGRDYANSDDPQSPSFRDLYEQTVNFDTKLEKVNDRLSRMEKGFIILTVVIASPKLGGPDASTFVTAAIDHARTAFGA
jgi:hypothetical protein